MQAQELRINNALKINGKIVNKIGYGVIMDLYQKNKGIKNNYLNTLIFKPIPLTEEWLLKFGFEKWTWCDDCAFISLFFGDSLHCRYYDDVWHIKRMKVGRDDRGVYGKTEGKYILPKGKIKYVHQLQNLYFALTGQELELK